LESWRAIARTLLGWAGKKQPTIAKRLRLLIESHARGLVFLPVVERSVPGISEAFIRDFADELARLDFGRGKLKPDLEIPRKSLWLAHSLLTSLIRKVRQKWRDDGFEGAIEVVWELFESPVPGRVLGERTLEAFRVHVGKNERAIWDALLRLFCFAFSLTPTSGSLKSMVEVCVVEKRPAEASVAILQKICGVESAIIRREVSRHKPRKS
jgi:hypothetical protein